VDDAAAQRRDGWAGSRSATTAWGAQALDAAGSGLRGLCDRIDALGGRISVESVRDAVATVRARVPV
jgi:signal transduction histidine kinase